MSSSRKSEAVLVNRVTEFLLDEGCRVRTEVPNMGQSADLVATKGRWVTFIEAKVSDWQRAVGQCVAHEQVADYVCIAMWGERPTDRLKSELIDRGYGLILCSSGEQECRWVIKPIKNEQVWQPQRRRLSVTLRNVNYVD